MAVVLGTVVGVKVIQSSTTGTAKVFVVDDITGLRETLQLWDDIDGVIPDRVTQSMWVAQCRDALVNGKQVLIDTGSGTRRRSSRSSCGHDGSPRRPGGVKQLPCPLRPGRRGRADTADARARRPA
jgi:hypothetical protein